MAAKYVTVGDDELGAMRVVDTTGAAHPRLVSTDADGKIDSSLLPEVGAGAEHAENHATGGSDPLTPEAIGAAPASDFDQALKTSDSPHFVQVTLDGDPVETAQAATKGYVDSLVQGLAWQSPVLSFVDFTASEPASPTLGDRHVNTRSGDSSVTAQAVLKDAIYEWNGSSWNEKIATNGMAMWTQDTDALRTYNGTDWIGLGSASSHNSLTGVQGGAPTQYYHLTAAQLSSLSGFISTSPYNRANHSGTQAIATVDGLQSALDGKATSAQGSLAESAIQPGDDVAQLGSGMAPNGRMLAADGAGGMEWKDFPPSVLETFDIDTLAKLNALVVDATLVDSGSLASVAFSGDYANLSGKPTLGTAATTDAADYATAAQGALADTSIQPGDPLTDLASHGAVDGQVPVANGTGGIAWGTVSTGDGTTSLSADIEDALEAATNPSAGNAFATLSDVTALDADIEAALGAATNPSAGNAFATLSDVTSMSTVGGLTNLDGGGANSVYTAGDVFSGGNA